VAAGAFLSNKIKMAKKKKKPNQKLQAWIDARKRHKLSHAQVQMARELGMNPKKLGKIDNHDQEPWKMPMRQYIEHLYYKRFGKERPDTVMSIEEKIRRDQQKKAKRREARQKVSQLDVEGTVVSERLNFG